MSNLKDTLRYKMFEAMKQKDTVAKKAYSMALDAIQKVEKNKQKDLSQEEMVEVLRKEVKQYNETLEYAQNNAELKNECEVSINLLSEFIPKLMTLEEIEKYYDSVCGDIDKLKKNKGIIMKQMSQLKGKADMKMVNQFVESVLK